MVYLYQNPVDHNSHLFKVYHLHQQMYLKKKSLKKKEKNLGINIRLVVVEVEHKHHVLCTNEQDKTNKTCNDKGICCLTFPDFLHGWLFFTIIGQTFEWYRRK